MRGILELLFWFFVVATVLDHFDTRTTRQMHDDLNYDGPGCPQPWGR